MMWTHPNEQQHLAEYLHILMLGERVAARCTKAQAQIAVAPAMRRFFNAQARQEKMHAMVFHHAVQWLAPKGVSGQATPLMQQYETLIDEALERRDLAETVLATQVMLESLGEVCLNRLDAGMAKRGMGFRRLRHTVLNQERAHHDFGLRQLDTYVLADAAVRPRLQARAADYGGLIDHMIAAFQGAFTCFKQDMATFQREVQQGFPAWLVNAR